MTSPVSRVFTLCILGLTAVLSSGCDHPAAATAQESARTGAPALADNEVELPAVSQAYVKVAAVTASDVSPRVRAPAQIAFRDDAIARVGAPVEGRVIKVNVVVGDKVKKGDALVTLFSSAAADMNASLARAKVTLEAARRESDRQAKMLSEGVGTEAEKAAADARLAEAQAELGGAESAVRMLGSGSGALVTLAAPIAGTVLSKNVTAGATVTADGAPLVEVGDPSAIWAVGQVFEKDLGMIPLGADADLSTSTIDAPVHGRVVKIGAALDASRRAPVYVELAAIPATLRAGTYARLSISAVAQKAIAVPRQAVLIGEEDQYFVYVESGPGRYQRRVVTTGQAVEDSIPLLSGVQPGEKVVVVGAILLDGAASRVL